MKRSTDQGAGESASQLISKRIAELGDWRGETLGEVRALIKEAVPDIVEEWKWLGTPVWSHGGIVCTGESYKSYVKLTFAKGAFLKDPSGLFNAGLEGNLRRAIDIHQGEQLDARALQALIRAAVALNAEGKKPAAAAKPAPRAVGAKPAPRAAVAKAAPHKPGEKATPRKAAPGRRATPAKRGVRSR